MKSKFIYIDLNSINNNRVIIVNPKTFYSIVDAYGEMFSGMEIMLWSDDEDINGKEDPLISRGQVDFDNTEQKWFINVDPKKFKNLSKSEEYRNYSTNEIMGKR